METTPVQPFILEIINFGKALMLPMMVMVFFTHIALRALIYYTVKREETFVKHFEKRVHFYLEQAPVNEVRSFFVICKKLLEKTFYEMFIMRSVMRRRRLDYVVEPSDRLFLIQPGCAHITRDTLNEIKYLRYDGNPPPFPEITRTILGNNACFDKLFGIFPIGPLNDMLGLIPGLFIVAGIFGTFLGIMQALPELGSMDIKNPESTKLVMDTFLAKTAFSMGSSTVGILLSVISTVYNNFLSPEKLFMRTADRYERVLFRIWLRCQNNELPQQIPNFDEHRDPVEALAELAVDKELAALARKMKEKPYDPAMGVTPPAAPGSQGPHGEDPLKKAS